MKLITGMDKISNSSGPFFLRRSGALLTRSGHCPVQPQPRIIDNVSGRSRFKAHNCNLTNVGRTAVAVPSHLPGHAAAPDQTAGRILDLHPYILCFIGLHFISCAATLHTVLSGVRCPLVTLFLKVK